MVSTRRSGSLSSNNNSSSSSSHNNNNNNGGTSSNSKRPSSSSPDDKPPSPKRLKVENGGVEENSAGISGNSKEMCVSPPVDTVDCVPIDPPEGVAEAIDSVKADDVAATEAPVSSPVPEGNSPAAIDQKKSWLSSLRNFHRQSLALETLATPWCRLLSQYSQNENIDISELVYSIGSSRSCNFTLNDQTVSGTLCRIKHTQREGCFIAVLECLGSKGAVFVNGMVVKNNTSRLLHSGDEVVFGMIRSHAYIFQQLVMDVTVKAPLTVGNAEVQSSVGKYLPVEKRSGDPSAVAGASILASLSNLRPDLSRWRTLSTPKTHQDSELSTHAVIQDGSEMELDSLEGNSTPNVECDNTPDLGATSKNLALDSDPDCGLEAGMALEERDELMKTSQPASTPAVSLRCAAFKEDIRAGIVDGNTVEVSFDEFPYYLSLPPVTTRRHRLPSPHTTFRSSPPPAPAAVDATLPSSPSQRRTITSVNLPMSKARLPSPFSPKPPKPVRRFHRPPSSPLRRLLLKRSMEEHHISGSTSSPRSSKRQNNSSVGSNTPDSAIGNRTVCTSMLACSEKMSDTTRSSVDQKRDVERALTNRLVEMVELGLISSNQMAKTASYKWLQEEGAMSLFMNGDVKYQLLIVEAACGLND